MNRTTLRKITELASFVFEDKEYMKFIRLIISKSFGKARILLEKIIIDLEMNVTMFSTSLLKKADELENLVMELIIEEMDNEGEQIKHITG